MWIGALYYATGIPYLLKAVPPFAEFLRFTAIEAPLTPLLTNPLTVLLAGIGLYRLWWKPDLQSSDLATLRLRLIGHAVAVVLIFAYFAFTLRYRFDLAPFMTLAAFVGYRSVSITVSRILEAWQKRLGVAAAGLCVLGHPRKPLRASRSQDLEHRCADGGSPRPLAFGAVCPRSAPAVISARQRLDSRASSRS
jgi:hypothetical protein